MEDFIKELYELMNKHDVHLYVEVDADRLYHGVECIDIFVNDNKGVKPQQLIYSDGNFLTLRGK